MHAYISAHICMCKYMFMYMWVGVCAYMYYACMCMYVCVFVYAQICKCVYVRVFLSVCVCMCLYLWMCCVYEHVYVCVIVRLFMGGATREKWMHSHKRNTSIVSWQQTHTAPFNICSELCSSILIHFSFKLLHPIMFINGIKSLSEIQMPMRPVEKKNPPYLLIKHIFPSLLRWRRARKYSSQLGIFFFERNG